MNANDLFKIVDCAEYHAYLMSMWIRLSKDGLVPKDDVEIFGEVGKRFANYILDRKGYPEYDVLVGWVAGGY